VDAGPRIVSDPGLLLCYHRASRGQTTQSLGRKPRTERGGVTPCFLFRYRFILLENYQHGVDFKSLQTYFYSLLEGAEFELASCALTDPCVKQPDWLNQI
jgi:hypothetical protein